jgi:hypothetical protein
MKHHFTPTPWTTHNGVKDDNFTLANISLLFLELCEYTLLTVYIRIKVQVDLQADKSSVVVKGPFSLKCEPKVSNPWNKCAMQESI